MEKIQEKELISNNNNSSEIRQLILFNDDVNDFDFVIKCLIEICKHAHEQAEQCAMIAHFKGKCAVFSGSFEELKPMFDELTRRNLSMEIK
jgi:ATP-dependent Clp protease adaptor protein ClpS